MLPCRRRRSNRPRCTNLRAVNLSRTLHTSPSSETSLVVRCARCGEPTQPTTTIDSAQQSGGLVTGVCVTCAAGDAPATHGWLSEVWELVAVTELTAGDVLCDDEGELCEVTQTKQRDKSDERDQRADSRRVEVRYEDGSRRTFAFTPVEQVERLAKRNVLTCPT